MNAATMGQDAGPEHGFRPEDAVPVLIGHLPSVQATVHTGRLGHVDDIVGRVSIFIVFVMWVVIPLAGALGIILGQ